MPAKVVAEFRSRYKVHVVVSTEEIVWHVGKDPVRVTLDEVAFVEVVRKHGHPLPTLWCVLVWCNDLSSITTHFTHRSEAEAMGDAITAAVDCHCSCEGRNHD